MPSKGVYLLGTNKTLMIKTSQILLLLTFVGGLLFTQKSFGQYSETIVTGRPGQSIVANTVGKGILQLQQGFIFSSAKSPGSVLNSTGVYVISDQVFQYNDIITTENVIRYGITERFELNSAINYNWEDNHGDDGVIVSGKDGGYLGTLDIGGRLNIIEQENFVPTMALQARLGMGQSYSEGDFEITDVEITAAFAWQIAENHGITVNLIPIFTLNDLYNRYNYTLAYSFSFLDRWSVFVENYGGLSTPQQTDAFFTTYFDGGVAFLLNDNVQIDVLGGYGKNEYLNMNEKTYFVSAGISWRLKTTK